MKLFADASHSFHNRAFSPSICTSVRVLHNCFERTFTLRNRKCKTIKLVKKYEKACIGNDTSSNHSLVAPAENNTIASLTPVCSSNDNSVTTGAITAIQSSFTTTATSDGVSRNEQRYSILDQNSSKCVTF